MALTFPNNMVRFILCSPTEYDSITTKNNNVFYRVVDDNNIKLYLGDELLSNDDELKAAILRITQNENDIDTIQQQLGNLRNYDDTELRNLISAEQSARTTADNALGDRITSLDNNTYSKEKINEKVSGLESAINGKVSTDTYNTKVTALESAIGQAASAASVADGKAVAAQTTANAAKTTIDTFMGTIEAGGDAVDTLQEVLDLIAKGDAAGNALLSDVADLKKKLETETNERTTADTKLDGKISANATAITQETNDRTSAISKLTNTVNSKANQTDFDTLSGTVSGHTASINTLQGSVSNNKKVIEDEVTRAKDAEEKISQELNGYKDTVATTYETKNDATDKQTALESKITETQRNIIGGIDSYANWNDTPYETTVVGAKKFAHDVALNVSIGAVGVAKQNTATVVQNLIDTYLTWNSLSSLS